MKIYIRIILFLTITNGYCQKTELDSSLINKQNLTLIFFENKNLIIPNNTSLNFSKETFKKRNFSIYNKSINFNSNYYITNNSAEFTGFQTIPQNNFQGAKIDSFNPHGATEMWAAVLIGVFDLLTK